MTALTLSEEVKRVRKPPCEQGCPDASRCASEMLACGRFLQYVNFAGQRPTKTGILRPSRALYKIALEA